MPYTIRTPFDAAMDDPRVGSGRWWILVSLLTSVSVISISTEHNQGVRIDISSDASVICEKGVGVTNHFVRSLSLGR